MPDAYILTKVTPSKEAEVLEHFSKIEAVKDANLVHGKFDLVARVQADSLEELKATLLDSVRVVPHLEQTCTLIVANASV